MDTKISSINKITYLRAKTYFDLKEYLRTANFLEKSNVPKSVFLRRYSLYLAGEKQKDEQSRELEEHSPVINTELRNLCEEFRKDEESGKLDGFGKYLYGVILKELHLNDQAQRQLIESCCLYPWNWSAWLALSSLCIEAEQLRTISQQLPAHYMTNFFISHAQLELQLNQEGLQSYEKLQEHFPVSRYITQQIATANYNLRG